MKRITKFVGLSMVMFGFSIHSTLVDAADFTVEEQDQIIKYKEKYQNILNQDYYAPWETMFESLPNTTNAPYSYGKTKDLYQQQSKEYINFIRSFNNLPSVSLSDEDITVAQQAAAGMASINKMSHGLDNALKPAYISQMEWDAASKATNESNLLSGGPDIMLATQPIDSWMKDSGSNNKAVGHRAWILNYNMKTTGVGVAKNSNGTNFAAMRVKKDTPPVMSTPNNLVVSWPSMGVFPTNYLSNGYRWSTHFNYKSYDLSGDVKVKLTNTDTNQSWNFSRSESDGEFELTNSVGSVVSAGYYDTIMFNPDKISYKEGDKFTVEITGLKGVASSYSYDVTLFDLAKKEPLVVPLTNFEVKEKEVTIKIGETYTPEFVYTPAYATNKRYSYEYKNTKILQTNSMLSGSVKGKEIGTDTVTYTSSDGGLKTKVTVTVVDPSEETISDTLPVPESAKLSFSVTKENGSAQLNTWSGGVLSSWGDGSSYQYLPDMNNYTPFNETDKQITLKETHVDNYLDSRIDSTGEIIINKENASEVSLRYTRTEKRDGPTDEFSGKNGALFYDSFSLPGLVSEYSGVQGFGERYWPLLHVKVANISGDQTSKFRIGFNSTYYFREDPYYENVSTENYQGKEYKDVMIPLPKPTAWSLGKLIVDIDTETKNVPVEYSFKEFEIVMHRYLVLSEVTVEQLSTVKGIDETLAQRILAYRDKYWFESIEDLLNVEGVDENLLNELKEQNILRIFDYFN